MLYRITGDLHKKNIIIIYCEIARKSFMYITKKIFAIKQQPRYSTPTKCIQLN